MVAVVTELAQQIVQSLAFGHKNCGAQQGTDVQFGRPLQLEQVLGQQDTNDVFGLPFINRETRVCGLDHLVQQAVKRVFDVEQIHPRCGHHHIACGHVGHADDAFKHEAALGIDDVVVLGLGQGFDQLVGRVGAGMDEFGELLQKTALVFTFNGTRRVRVGHSREVQDMRLWASL